MKQEILNLFHNNVLSFSFFKILIGVSIFLTALLVLPNFVFASHIPAMEISGFDAPGAHYGSLYTLDANTIFVAYKYDPDASVKLAKSTDGGKTWQNYIVASGVDTFNFNAPSLSVPNSNTIYIAFDDKLAKSTNGGQTWNIQDRTTIDPIYPPPSGYTSIDAVDSNTVFMSYGVYSKMRFLKSTDGGSTWSGSWINISNPSITRTQAINSNVIFVSSSLQYSQGINVAKSTDGGGAWQILDVSGLTAFQYYYDFFALDQNNLFLASLDQDGAGLEFSKSIDGGQTWQVSYADSNAVFNDPPSILAIDASHIFISYETSYLVYPTEPFSGTRLAESADGGQTWQISNTAQDRNQISVYAIDFNNPFMTQGNAFIKSAVPSNIQVKATLNGAPWNGTVNYTLFCPINFNGNNVSSIFTYPPPDSPRYSYMFTKTSSCTLSYLSGGPSGATTPFIRPVGSQPLLSNSTIIFILNFTANTYTLTVTKSGVGSGTVTSAPAGINCGADCSEPYTSGTSVTLTAAPSAGSIFAGWSGDADCSDGIVTMSVAKTCTATFNTCQIGVNWTQATASAPWNKRQEFGLVVFNNKMWLMGGIDIPSDFKSDVWSSSDGVNWIQETANAGWGQRGAFASMVYNNKMWVMGGCVGPTPGGCVNLVNDVWSSSDGVNWIRETAGAPWNARSFPASVAYNNKMWIMSGQTSAANSNDVWSSTDGVSWTQATSSAAWAGRAESDAVVYNNKMWIMNGVISGPIFLNDVWSSTDGASWTQATANAAWPDREGTRLLDYGGKMWLIGGSQSSPFPPYINKNDVWSSTDGVNWVQETANASWMGRLNHGSVIYNNKMWVMGGVNSSHTFNDVFYSSCAQSDKTLTVTKSVTGSGTVNSVPAGINCGADCFESYTNGTAVTLIATPNTGAGYIDGTWGGNCSGYTSTSCPLTMNADKSVSSIFYNLNIPLIDIRANGLDGPITIPYNSQATITWQGTGGAISCFVASSVIPVPPGPSWSTWVNGVGFTSSLGWLVGLSGSNQTINITNTTTYTAICVNMGPPGFGSTASDAVTILVIPPLSTSALTVTKAGTGTGTVTSAPAGINCGADCLESYTNGTSVTLNASAVAGSTFTGWSGGGCFGTGPCTLIINSDKNVTAAFDIATGFGTIQLDINLENLPWPSPVNFTIIGPENMSGVSGPYTFSNKPTGTYTLVYNSGGPEDSVLSSINPALFQTLTPGDTITFALDFEINCSAS